MKDFQHQTGRATANGYQAAPGDAPGYMLFGPYTQKVPAGTKRVAVYRMSVDATSPAADQVATIDVNDAAASRVLATRAVTRGDFRAPSSPQQLWLDFDAPAGGNLEFRVNYAGKGTLTVHGVDVRPGSDVIGQSGCELRTRGAAKETWLPAALLVFGIAMLRIRVPR